MGQDVHPRVEECRDWAVEVCCDIHDVCGDAPKPFSLLLGETWNGRLLSGPLQIFKLGFDSLLELLRPEILIAEALIEKGNLKDFRDLDVSAKTLRFRVACLAMP